MKTISEDLKTLKGTRNFGGLGTKKDYLNDLVIDVACNVVFQASKKDPDKNYVLLRVQISDMALNDHKEDLAMQIQDTLEK